MANATRDDNYVAVILGVSTVDASTPIQIKVSPVTGAVQVEN